MFTKLTAAAAAMLVVAVNADIYMHNPRGSNNRLDEARRDRNNGNRVFDSQNNNRGGSNVGSLYYFNEEELAMEWTNQHGCGQDINDCQLVVQYMCDDLLRDGVTTRTIPETPTQCLNNDCNTDVRYGMHESYDYYMNCKYRFRNRGLFNADRNLNGNTARFTRQNNNGNRRGYECPEERDMYPYWHPTPWIDLAVYTTAEDDDDFKNRCSVYQSESENVKGRHYCSIPDSWYHNMIRNGGNGNNGFIPNTEVLCQGEDGTGGLNAENSQMMQFIAQKDAPATAALEAKIATEFASCITYMQDLSDICTNGTDNCPQYAALFEQDDKAIADRKYVLESDFATPCPICNGTLIEHPYSTCSLCGPATCANAFSMMVVNTTDCPPGFVEDPNSEWCVTEICTDAFTSLTIDQINTNEECRGNIVADKFLVENIDTDSSMKQCAERTIASKSCRLQGNRATWTQAPAHNVATPTATAPECRSATWSRENHLGNGIGGQQNGHNFSMPAHIHERCAMRLRYNITTKDYIVGGAWVNPHYSVNLSSGELSSSLIDSTYNKRNGNNPAKIELNTGANVPTVDSSMPYENARGFLWKNNPKVSIFDFDELVMYCDTPIGTNLGNGLTADAAPRDQVVNGDRTWCYPIDNSTAKRYRAKSAFCPSISSSAKPSMMDTVRFEADGTLTTGTAGDGCAEALVCTDTASTPARACQTRNMDNNGVRRQTGNNNNNDNSDDKDFRLQMAINTNQFGRTFQDRSFSYEVRAQSPKEAECNKIYALNVRGKRGNVVQTFPGTEYDFVPNRLQVREDDCIHFQWTGSNTNPNNNDGQGKQGTDRSNIVLQEYNRGEGAGGRGVSRFGGKGADGTTWTTLNMDPGFEGYLDNKFQKAPEMFDFPCDTAANRVTGNVWAMGYGAWKYCSNANPSDPATSDVFMGISNTSTCTAGYTAYSPTDTSGALVCVKNANLGTLTSVARLLTDEWTGMGEDNRDLASLSLQLAKEAVGIPNDSKFGAMGNSHPEHLDNATEWRIFGASREYLEMLATLVNMQFRGEMSELDDAGTYADFGAQLITGAIGRIAYLCTRNNNFSNRSQKGVVIVSHSTSTAMNCGKEECVIVSDGAVLQVPEGQSVGPITLSNKAASADNGATRQSASDVVQVTGNLNTQKIAMWGQTAMMSAGGTTRRQVMNETGLWVQAFVPEPLNVPGDNYSISIHLKSPNSSALWKTSETLDDTHQYMCATLKWDTYTEKTHFLLATWNDLIYSWTIPMNLRQSLSDAYESENVWLDIQFPTNTDGLYNCSGEKHTVQQMVDQTEQKFEITIPTLAVWKIGQVEHFTGKQATMCFEDGNSEACDVMKAQSVASTCDGEACTVSCTKKCDGYYRVQAEDTIPMIIGITLAVVIVSALLIGAAFYYRRNPEKWDSLKMYGPNKYKSIKLSIQDKV